jgi:hypothetical protein
MGGGIPRCPPRGISVDIEYATAIAAGSNEAGSREHSFARFVYAQVPHFILGVLSVRVSRHDERLIYRSVGFSRAHALNILRLMSLLAVEWYADLRLYRDRLSSARSH